MRNKFLFSVIAIPLLMSGSAMAQVAAGGGVTASDPGGSIAGGASAGVGSAQERKAQREQRRDARQRGAERSSNSAQTYGSGSVYTDRERATGGVTSGASASGTGSQSAGSSVNAYGETTREGSNAEVYGDAAAESQQPRR